MGRSKWTIDPTHSSIDFSVKHMMVSKVKGTFHAFESSIEADPSDLTTATIQITINVDSIDTRNGDRDNHLKSADFFEVENYPKITFKSTNIEKKGEDEYEVIGELTIRDTTKPVTLDVTFEGQGKDPWGNEVAGFSGKGKIKRSDFGLTWNTALETGGVLVGDDITISIDVEAKKEA